MLLLITTLYYNILSFLCTQLQIFKVLKVSNKHLESRWDAGASGLASTCVSSSKSQMLQAAFQEVQPLQLFTLFLTRDGGGTAVPNTQCICWWSQLGPGYCTFSWCCRAPLSARPQGDGADNIFSPVAMVQMLSPQACWAWQTCQCGQQVQQ